MRTAILFLLTVSGCRCSDASFSPDEAARICMTLQACSPREFSSTYGNSLAACTTNPSLILPWPGTLENKPVFTTGLEEPFRDVYRCMLEAKGECAKAAACWRLDGDAGACTFGSGITRGNCSNNTLSGCTLDSHRFQVNCEDYQATCTDLNLFGSFNICAAQTCPAVPTCRGNQAGFCSGSTVLLWDCSRSGRTCQVSEDGGVGCRVGEKTCNPSAGRRCDGDVVVACEGIGFEARTDCAKSPTFRRCVEGECVATGSECTLVSAPTCEGSAVKFCQDGYLTKIDCAGAGFGGCDAGACLPKR